MIKDPAESTADPAALARRGVSLLAGGRDEEALTVWQELVRQQPRHIPHRVNLGTVLRKLGRLEEALYSYIEAAALGECSASFLYNVGLLHQDRGDYESARRVLADAVERAPTDPEIRLHYAQCCYESLHIETATLALKDWRDLQPLSSDFLATLALLLLNLGEPEAAREAASEAAARVAADPRPSATTLLRLAQIQERRNRLAEAQETLKRLGALKDASVLGPDLKLLEAQIDLRQGRYEGARRQFSSLAARCAEPYRRHLYLFPLAKALDGLKRYDEAYTCLLEAHEAQLLHLARTNPDAAGLREPPLLITRYGCNRADIDRWDESEAPNADDSPVFVVGFPRSGTTLLEQMLDAHPQLVTMDEQPFLQMALDRLADLGSDYPASLAAVTTTELAGIREYYWSLTRDKVRLDPGQRLIDKNPLNILRLPAIRRLFPRARVLLAIRHPCDVILSCFMQHFRAPEFALLCRDLPTLARSYCRTFDFWYQQCGLLQPAVHEIHFESLVENFASESRKIMGFLNLDWDPAQGTPGANALARGYISTPSYAQVIEPVNRRGVGRWKAYESRFEEAPIILRPYLDRWGYS